jgi:hypothetical protein
MQRAIVPGGSPTLVAPLLTVAVVRARAADTTGIDALLREVEQIRAPRAGAPPAPPFSLAQSPPVGEALCALGRAGAAADVLRRGLAGAGEPPAPAESQAVRYGRAALDRGARPAP